MIRGRQYTICESETICDIPCAWAVLRVYSAVTPFLQHNEKPETTMKALAVLIVILVVAFGSPESQANDNTLFGRDFRFAFLPALHSPGEFDSLHVVVQGDSATRGELQYTDRDGVQHTQAFELQGPDFVWRYAMHWRELELQGIHDLDGINNIKIYDDAHRREVMGVDRVESARIVVDNSEADVQVFAGTTVENTTKNPVNFFTGSDFCQVLPVDMLSTDYIVQSWPSDGREDNVNPFLYSSTPSHFAVVAAYPNTRVSVELSSDRGVFWNTSKLYTLTLDAGEVVYFAANVTQDLEADLSGSLIDSDKPVAVFSGHVAAEVPSRNEQGNGNLNPLQESRDPLFTQNIPLEQFGTTYVVAPLVAIADDGNAQDAVAIVNGLEDSDVRVNGAIESSLLPRGVDRFNLQVPSVITTTDSVGAALIMGSANTNYSVSTGDPSMITLPDASSWPTTATWSTPDFYEGVGASMFSEHHVLIASPSDRLANIMLNGDDISAQFLDIDGRYAYYQNLVGSGTHTVVADTGVMVVAYGFGTGCSYGFSVGKLIRDVPVLLPLQATFGTAERNASPGDTIDIPILMKDRNIDVRWFANGDLTMEFTLSWNATLLYPLQEQIDSIVDGRAFTTVSTPLSDDVSAGQEVATISMLVGLGDALADRVTVASVRVFSNAGTELTDDQLNVELLGSQLYIENVWIIDGQPLLVNPQQHTLGLSVSPNPSPGAVTFTFEHADGARGLKIFDDLGRLVLDLTDEIAGLGSQGTLQTDLSTLPRGSYTVRLSSGNSTIARLMILE